MSTSPDSEFNATARTLLPSSPGATGTPIPSDRLAGWMPAGMLDWPGRVSATIFLAGCQLRCPYCHNPSLIAPFGSSPTELWHTIVSYLDRRSEWIDGIVITGGEPTLDPGLELLLEYLKSRHVPVKLDTNGMRPDLLKSLLYRNLVDFVALDVKALPERYADLTSSADSSARIERSIRIVLDSEIEHEFRTTCYPGVIHLGDMLTIAQMLAGGHSYMLQQFRPDTTLHAQAASVAPFSPDDLSQTAEACSKWIPTSVRGA